MNYQLRALHVVEFDIETAFKWYESEQLHLGQEFLAELHYAYDLIEDNPFKYQLLKYDIRRALLRRFPYAVYFTVNAPVVTIIAVLHASRSPDWWQQRGEHFVNEPQP